MNPWTTWLETIAGILGALASDVGLGLGLAIIAATLLLRAVLLPLAWPIAYRACLRQRKLTKLQPELRALQDELRDRPDAYLARLREVYRAHGVELVDGKSLLAALVQLPVFVGMFQVLRDAGAGVRFLWVANLQRPDLVLALIAGLATALMMAVNPDMPDQLRLVMIVLPSLLAVVAALQFSSALAIYWATSNVFSAAQTVVLHSIVRRRGRAAGER